VSCGRYGSEDFFVLNHSVDTLPFVTSLFRQTAVLQSTAGIMISNSSHSSSAKPGARKFPSNA